MDRETTQRLLKESIIFLCRTYVGDVSDFEVDSIICISHDDGSLEKQVVFKIHELVTRGQDEKRTSENFIGAHFDLEGKEHFHGGVWKHSKYKKRKFNNSNSSIHSTYSNAQSQNNYSMSIPVFPELKIESQWSEDFLKSTHIEEVDHASSCIAITKNEQTGSDMQRCYSCDKCNFTCMTKLLLAEHCKEYHIPVCDADAFEQNHLMKTVSETDMSQDIIKIHENEKYKHGSRANGVQQVISSSAIFPIAAKNHQGTRNNGRLTVRLARESVGSSRNDCGNAGTDHEKLDVSEGGDIVDQNAPRQCANCDLKFTDFPAFNMHCKEAHDMFACPYCTKTFYQQSARDNHLFKHTGEKPFECPDCFVSFSRLDSLRRHRMKMHALSCAEVMIPLIQSVPVDSISIDDDLGGGAEMDKNGVEDDNQLNRFMSFHSSHLRDGGAEEGGSNDAVERLIELSRSHYTDSCQSSDAIEISDEESSGRAMRGRYRNITTLDPDRVFACGICCETIHGTTAFRDHCDSMHRRVPCQYCGATFTQKASMERHQRQHTGERPHKCSFCEHTYTRKENLQTHMMRLHPLVIDGD